MTEHTIEAHFEIKSNAAIAERSARIDARVIELLAAAIAPPGHSSGRERLEAPKLAEAIYRAISALPHALAKAVKEVDGGS